MERYAQKLRALKMKKARDMFGKAAVNIDPNAVQVLIIIVHLKN
jgi:hypothetical protein